MQQISPRRAFLLKNHGIWLPTDAKGHRKDCTAGEPSGKHCPNLRLFEQNQA